MAKGAFNRKTFYQQIGLKFKEQKQLKCNIWSTLMYDANTWTLRNVYQNYLKSSEMWR
jgi:hypothetical protein